nr:integrase, catalytic region, zinc finger, CCHC-type, peptidase aspartic, catalytic [Tanacetum cinerariifolium]
MSSVRYSWIGVTHVHPLSSTNVSTSISSIDFSFSSSTSTCLLRWAKLVDAILLSVSAFLFSPLGTCLIENSLKVLVRALTFSKYLIMPGSFAMPAIKASYSASLLVALNLNLRAYVNSTPFGFVTIRPAPEPSMHDDPSVNSIHGSESSSSSSMGVSGWSSSGRFTIKSARICHLTDVLGLYWMLCSSGSKLHLISLSVTSEFDIICFIAARKHLKGYPQRDSTFQSISEPTPSSRPTKVEVPKELPKVSMSQEKDMVISKLKERIKSLSGHKKEDKIKKELEEIETINIVLDHRVSKLVAENEHLKQTYKQLYDSIKSTRKALADDVVTSHSIAPEMFNVDVEPLNPRLLNNRSAHSDYLKYTQEEAATLREIVEQGKSKNPLNAYLDSAYNGTEFVNQTLREYYKQVGISHETSVARSPQQNGIVERRNRTLIEVARTMMIYAKALLFLWAEEVATACYTQNRSIIRIHHGKTPYELLHDKLPDLSFFHVSGALCYSTNDSENLLFQPLFDELLTPPPSVDHPAPEVITPITEVVAPEPAASTDSPSSTTVDQDAPSSIEPKNFKQAMTEPSWFDAMQEEIHKFEKLQVWELVPCPDKVLLSKLK